MMKMANQKEMLMKRVEEVCEALQSKGVPYEPITALALAEVAVQIAQDCFKISHTEARVRLIQAEMELLKIEVAGNGGEKD